MTTVSDTQARAPSVSRVAADIDGALRQLGDGWVEGEISAINVHRSSGHVYLTLADEDSSLDACIWRGRATACKPLPKQGELVQAHYERVSFYAPRGSTKLIVDRIKPTGEGELLRRRAETLARLRADGLCDPDRRKPLPSFPSRVGVIAARNDAHIDVIQALKARFPPQDILFCPAAVQGVHAVGSLIDALGRLQAVDEVDVIVIARGGGATADLLPFDDERLCRAIFACAVPVITSIGHTKDRPNCDHVAAAFAPVPARAAELAVRHSAAELIEELDRQRARMRCSCERVLKLEAAQLNAAGKRITSKASDLKAAVDRRGQQLTRECRQALQGGRRDVSQAGERLAPAARRLLRQRADRSDALISIVRAKDFRRKGWVMATDRDDMPIVAANRLRPGEEIGLRFADGNAQAVVAAVEEESHG